MDVEIKIIKKFTPSQLTLVCGLPGMAYIGKLSVDYLVQQLKAELVGEIYSKYFPPYVIIKEDGIVELLRNELHHYRDETGRDFVFLSGNSQAFSPEGQYEVADKILDWAIEKGLTRVYSVAALVTDRPFETPSVHFTATSAVLIEEIKKHGVQQLDHGIIGGENGIIMGLAKKKDIEGVCLMAETHGYQAPTGEYVIDPKAAKAALTVLTSILNLKVNMEPMEKQAIQMDEAIAKMSEIERRVRQEMVQSGKKPSYVT
ncbi:MAG TPA: PAC2 family protein [Candidatus Bathyarchaeia archaeon]|nr:PAC2 family protein [Candidatus Bathyarchaeia archaeon]